VPLLYHVYEFHHAAVTPLRSAAAIGQQLLRHPFNPLAYTYGGRSAAAAFDLFEKVTRRYGKPDFDIETTKVNGVEVGVSERVVWRDTFGRLIHFARDPNALLAARGRPRRPDPTVLIVAPLSGHYATLLRDTVRAMLPEHEVYITDWRDARTVPALAGHFDLNDYIDYIIAMTRHLDADARGGVHVMGVCQPGPAVLAATALMAAADDPATPASMVLMGSPIDTRQSPTEPNHFAKSHSLGWFAENMIATVPWPNGGFGRAVYPGFLQLSSFMSMNAARHTQAHWDYFDNLVKGDGDSAQKHREFYDEYLAVMDLTAEFYLQTVDEIFQRHLLPRGRMRHRGKPVDPRAIRHTALMTVEGEKDDISGIGQTQAAHDVCANIPARHRVDYVQPDVGHYGVFNGSRWRSEIQPRVREFIRAHMRRA
jgi:poly(3-hydroxybutyrate) depolymerase